MNGKGSRPRNNHSNRFRFNYDNIDFGHKYYWVMEHGRPIGLENRVYIGTVTEKKARDRKLSPCNPYGTNYHRFDTRAKAEEWIRSHVQNKKDCPRDIPLGNI